MRAKQNKKRDNKVLALDSDGESDSSEEAPIDKNVQQDLHQMF